MATDYGNFRDFFKAACKHDPYDYQCRLACGENADLQSGRTCDSLLIDIPTGLGKTAAVVLAWMWNRVARGDSAWPRRLVYCLPMRTLVEQTQKEVEKWAQTLFPDSAQRPKVYILMGGEGKSDFDLYPERDAILIGTQDMLLSAALNRGYGVSRYRWPMQFALLNNDCLWVLDETQLMGVGVETSAQLDGFRRLGKAPAFGPCPTWWMSATLDGSRLATVDHPRPAVGWPKLELSMEERASGRACDLFQAHKPVEKYPVALDATTGKTYAQGLAKFIKQEHKEGTLTLVIVNRVQRAQEIYAALTGGKKPLYDPARVALIHSRFRPGDRAKQAALLTAEGDRIVIATQAIEAGVDVSARLLITELAPWSSLVQRFGRCRRRAEPFEARIVWVDLQPKDEKDALLLPYAKDELDQARAEIEKLEDAAPSALRKIEVAEKPVVRSVIRRRDLTDLFDTTPDIAGQDLDISRYIRDDEDSDVQFYWRNLSEETPPPAAKGPDRNELCRVSVVAANTFLKKKIKAWRWNALDKKWDPASRAVPGAVYLIDLDDKSGGGYDIQLGWTGDNKHKPTPFDLAEKALPNPALDDEPDSVACGWQTIAEHTARVVAQADALAGTLALPEDLRKVLHTAAVWHDVGKGHAIFQAAIRQKLDEKGRPLLIDRSDVAKAPRDWWDHYKRRHFRHELASALAWLLAGPKEAVERDLIAYIIVAHHGKIRLSIRSMPGEKEPDEAGRLFARGVWHDDDLPSLELGEITTPAVKLDLTFMKMGEGENGPSWLARTVAMRDRLGPFRLAYLETLLRAADMRASMPSEND